MQFFKQLTDPALKRLYKFVLKRLIGRFLAEDEIDLDQLDVHLRSGRLELCDLLLNADVLNAEICEANGLPFRVKKGYLGSVRVTISYTNIMSESCLVEIDDIEIVLVPVGKAETEESGSGTPGHAAQGEATESGNSDADTKQQTAGSMPRATSREQIDEVSQEGLDFVASWIEQVTSKIKVTLSNICLRLETGDTAHGKNVALLCKLEWAQFTDESASEVASVYAGGASTGASQSMYQSMAASSLFGISQKAVKFRGISMDLLLPSDDVEEDDSGSELHHFLASDSTRQCYVQVKLSHYEALDAPSIDADLFLHSIRVVLQPQHFSHFGTLLDAFSDEAPAISAKDRYTTSSSMYASVCDTRPAWLNEDDQDSAAEAGAQLSLREFQRIELLLQQYHKTHEDLKSAQRERLRDRGASYEQADFTYPVPRKLSIAESVESVGLSDLEDDDAFFECDTGAESLLVNSRYGGASDLMAQSMYASALYDHAETESSGGGGGAASASLRASVRRGSSRDVRNRVKLHLLECEIVILYDDLPDHDTDDEDDGKDHSSESLRQRQLRRRRRGLPTITDQERLEISVKDVILSTLVYPSHVAISVSVGTFVIVERMLARMSTDVVDDGDALLRTTILRFADVSPATGRKVHLSANLSAQFRLDLKPDGSVESLALQVGAQPILLEWDMHIIDRAHRLMTLMEESSAAAQKKKSMAKSSATVVPEYPKKLDVNTECVEITLRFPMVSSDLIRFGPSAKRGLSEDKLVLLLEGVKASSYEHTSDAELPPTKVQLPWLAEFDVNFDSVNAWLVGPLCGDQRSKAVDKSTLLTGQSDTTSGDKCGLRIRLQVPTNDEVRSALTAKHSLSQDSLENHIEASASNSPDTEEKSGDDNDGGRVGSNGWSQDARSRAHAFEGAARAAALVDLEILIPHSTVVFDKRSFDRLMILFDALLMINPIDVNGHNQMMATSAYRNRLVPSYMSMEVTLKDGTIQLQYAPPPTVAAPNPSTSFIYHLAFQDLRIFQVSQWMGQLVSRVHVAAQNMTLLEEDCKSKATSPVLYKNPIGVNEAPILFVGMDIIDQTQEMREMKVELHVSQVNLRHEVSSLWMVYLAELLLLEYPPPIIPLDSASTNDDEYKEILEQIEAATYEAVKLAIAPKTVFTKLFVSFYDAMIDYAPTTLSSRVMVVLGNVSVSSNVVTGALIQGYKIAVKDMQLYLTPERPSYDEIDECILGSELFLTTNNAKRRAMVSFSGETRSRGQLSGLYPSLLVFFERHGFLLMVTMDFIDVFLRAIVPPVEPRGPLLTGEPELKVTPASLGAPELSVELNMGTANIYACFDSFNTLIELISTWSDQLSVEAEPRDTTGYVGLDRVKDVSSVSVVTNLGPATVRSSRPLMDDSFSPPLGTGQMDRASSRSSMRTTRASSTYSDRDSFSSSQRQDVANGGRSGLNLFSQLDENAFGGGGERVYSGVQATTDTEARLLRTRLDEIQKEKNRIVSGALSVGGDYDDALSATELRRKYKQDDVPNKPKVRINELVIDDYYAGNRASTSYRGDQPGDAGGFLMAAESEPVEPKSTVADSPWFASPPGASFQPAFPAGSHPVGSLPEEHSARWLAPSSMGGSPRSSSTTSSPRFDPVEEESPARELGSLDYSSLNAHTDDYDEHDEEDGYPMGAFPAGPKRWWGMQTQSDFELSELQTEETESSFSHQLPFMDDESAQIGDEQPVNPMSMSMMCTGEDEGTEVELDFTLDREMRSTFNRLMDSDDGPGDGMDDEGSGEASEDDVESASGPSSPYHHYQATTMPSPRMRSFHQEMSVPRSIPPRRTSFSDQSSQSGAPSTTGPAIISPPDEPTARWFYDDVAGSDACSREGPPSRIYPHHIEIPIGGTAASLSFGEKECDEAIRSVAREKAAMKLPASAPVVIRHVLLRDFNICMRFFGGSDWSRDLVNVPTLSRNRHQATIVSTENKSAPAATKDNKEKLLDALLDNYVSSSGSDLFGGDSSETPLFSDKPVSVPARSNMSDRSSSAKPSSSAATRKRSLKSGRKTEEMLELVVTRIQLRLDMFNDDDAQPLASNTVIALGDIEILDYISTSQIRKIICYWKSETTHPRESSSSMVHVHLMTVRPGRNLCEEHRLKVRILPLRVNLDQEVVSFLRQFVPTEAGTRRTSTSFPPGAIPEDDEHGDDGDDDTGGYDGTELSAMNVATPSRVTETDVSLGSWFFQSIEIRPCKIKIDYRPNRVDFQALRAGDYLEVINLFVLEGMELVLRRVKASGIDGWAGLGEHVLMSWVNDISRHQIHKCVASVSMPPLRSFANIGSGAADLILLPLEHYGRDRRVVRGLKKGAQSFLKSVTIETLNTASKVAQGTQALLEHADDVVSSAASRKKSIKYRQPGSRIARNSKRMGGGGIRSAQDRGGIGSRQYLAQQPSNATEGFYQAYDSLSRELHHAAKTIVAVPLVEYKKTGSGGYVRSVIRAVPVAVLRPMIGATEAMSKALIGVRNAVDPEMKEDVENKFKDFRTI